ncbi:uncharacterized protein LOC126797086 [Argentina anserina]|uniref:uncharacterized protein LOC126797086 n=1 Tax=Argentina anserina TaxID=57926 RepID=UPI002176432D|nr:uncharacterized protein LOC126797086 [Potentilla anserina]
MKLLKLPERRRFAPLAQNDVVDENDGVRRRSMSHSYKKLAPPPLLTLSVLKLDGSVFEIQVGRTATVAELKQAVELVFTSCKSNIPWSLVWGHFCLCHVDKKLTNDRANIRNFGIKDGDQIEFSRHMSISNMPLEKGSQHESVPYRRHLVLSYGSNGHEEKVQKGPEDFDNNFSQEDDSGDHPKRDVEKIEKGSENFDKKVSQGDDFEDHPSRDVEEGPVPESKSPRFWKGWLSYSKVVGGFKKGIERQELLIEMPEFLRKRI